MEFLLGGLRVAVEPEASLSSRERAALRGLAGARADALTVAATPPAVRLVVEDGRPWPADAGDAQALAPAPADVRAVDDILHVRHRHFRAEIDALRGDGRVWRREADGTGLLIALRVALAAALPWQGGLPLHAAGVILDGRGLAFFGPSGAGKSTLASSAREDGLRVLSDEQVTLLARPARLLASGFWGELDSTPSEDVAPLAALVELARGPELTLTCLAPGDALRRLLGVLFVPPQAALWSRALGLAGELARAVPVYRLAWNPAGPPWRALREELRGGALEREVRPA